MPAVDLGVGGVRLSEVDPQKLGLLLGRTIRGG